MTSELSEYSKIRVESLRQQRENDPAKYAATYKQCPRCEKAFKTKRDAKSHLRDCRREGAARVVIKVGALYPCQICPKVNDSLKTFKGHVFYKHQEAQV
jgi:translation initiation factor 2 beta subunit (eIF-2beta)/eIF-5